MFGRLFDVDLVRLSFHACVMYVPLANSAPYLGLPLPMLPLLWLPPPPLHAAEKLANSAPDSGYELQLATLLGCQLGFGLLGTQLEGQPGAKTTPSEAPNSVDPTRG